MVSKPTLKIDLRGPDGNVYAVIGKCCDALRRAGQGDMAARLKKEAFEQPNYEAVLEHCKKYVDVTFKW
jgi:hypothetical protein